jgi:hypothetical protein
MTSIALFEMQRDSRDFSTSRRIAVFSGISKVVVEAARERLVIGMLAKRNVSAPEREIQCLRGVACCKKVLLY